MHEEQMPEWRDIDGIPGYQVSSQGQVRSPRKVLKQWACTPGYLMVECGRKNKLLVHRIVAKAFFPMCGERDQVNHKNGNRQDNRVENLEWCTCSENHLHAFRELGRKVSGAFAVNKARYAARQEN
jgi:hypothetical protein